jgi:hypothetical protein
VLGQHQRLPEAGVEALGDLAHQLDVLLLVLADGHLVRLVGQHVGGLEDGIEEQARGDQLLLLPGLLLELVHPAELAVRRDPGEQPGQLGVLVHVRLPEQDAPLRIQARRQQDGGGVVEPRTQVGGVVRDRDRVEVDDAVDGVAPALSLDVLPDGADVVAEVLAPRRLDPGEDAHRAQGTGGRARVVGIMAA